MKTGKKPIVRNKNLGLSHLFLKGFSMQRPISENIFTAREKKIIQILGFGVSSIQIARNLFISKHTVDTHKKNIYGKGKFNDLRDVILFALFMHLGQKNTQCWVFSNVT